MFPEFERERRFIDMAPLVDLTFLLLIFFMVGSRFTEPAIDLALPEARTGKGNDTTGLVLSVARDGRVFLNGQLVPPGELEGRLKRDLDARPDRTITLRADGEIAFQNFIEVMDSVRIAGGRSMNIEHSRPHP